jgi:hypothetical protein
MWKPLAVFQAKVDLDKDAQDLTQKMFSAMIPDSDILKEDFFDRARSGNIHVNDSWTEVTPHTIEEDLQIQNEYLYLYQYILGYVTEKLGRIGSPLKEEPGQIDSALPLLAKQNEELERYNELLQLVERAEIKLDPDSDTPPARVIKPTALKLVKLLRKMGNRPLFTTAASLKRKVGSTSKAHIGSNQSFGHLKDFKFQF